MPFLKPNSFMRKPARPTRTASRATHQHRGPSVPCAANIAQFELANGIRIYAYENFASPAAIVSGYMIAGALDEPREKLGLAGFVADCLTRGTQRFSYEHIFEQTESIGANLSVSGGMFTTGFYSKSLSEDLPLMMALLGDVIRHPAFPRSGSGEGAR